MRMCQPLDFRRRLFRNARWKVVAPTCRSLVLCASWSIWWAIVRAKKLNSMSPGPDPARNFLYTSSSWHDPMGICLCFFISMFAILLLVRPWFLLLVLFISSLFPETLLIFLISPKHWQYRMKIQFFSPAVPNHPLQLKDGMAQKMVRIWASHVGLVVRLDHLLGLISAWWKPATWRRSKNIFSCYVSINPRNRIGWNEFGNHVFLVWKWKV